MVSLAKPKDFCVALALLVVSGVLYYESLSLDSGITHALGPAFFPRLLLYFIALMSLILLVQSLSLRPALSKPAGDQAGEGDVGKCGLGPFIMQWSFVALLPLYILALPYLGYVLGTISFLAASMLLLGPHKPRNLIAYAIVSVAVTFGLQFVFGTMLHLFLP